MSERRACRVLGADRTTIRYRSSRDDGELRERMRALAAERRRFGYRRLHILLEREGVVVNRKRTQRIYRELGLAVRRRRGRKRAVGTRAPILVAAAPNARWSMDFVHDQLADGRRLRILNVVDDMTKRCLAAVVDTSICGRRVVRELTALVARHGRPELLVSDNGTEFTSNALLAWSAETGIAWHYIAPGKPMRDTASARPSTAACATSTSTRRSSAASSMPATASLPGSTTTTPSARTRRSATAHRRPMPPPSPQRALGCAT
jgi:putative transposase